MLCHLKEKLILQDCVDLGQLTTKVIRVEQCICELNQRKVQTDMGGMQDVSTTDSDSRDSLDEEMTAK